MIEFEIELIGVVRFGLAGGVKRGDGGPKGHAGWVGGAAVGKVDQFVCNTSR